MARSNSSRRPTYSTGRSGKRSVSRRRAGPKGPAPTRHRGPVPIIIIAAVIIALVFCWVFGRGCGGSQQAQENEKLRAYTVAVNRLIQDSAAAAAQFENLKTGIKGISRGDIDKELSQVETTCRTIARESAKVTVPSKAASLQPLLQLTFDLRARGDEEFRTAITDALDKKDQNAVVQSLVRSETDLVVGDQVFQNYKTQLGSRLQAAKLTLIQVADAGQFVPNIDDAASTSINQYILANGLLHVTAQSVTAQGSASTPARVMASYLKNKGIDASGASYSVVSTSTTDPNWKLDEETGSGTKPAYFILHNVNGNWAVVDYGTGFTAANIKADGAPGDLSPP